MEQGPGVVADTGLSSPQRQTFYLLGLLMSTPEPEIEEPLPTGSWERIFILLNAITDSYVNAMKKAMVIKSVDPLKAKVASMAFIQRFMSGRLAVAEQLEHLIRSLCTPFDEQIQATVGTSATEALEIVEWMREKLIELWEAGFEKVAAAKAMQSKTVEMLFSGPESETEKLKAWQASEDFKKAQVIAQDAFSFMRYVNCIPIQRFIERFGQERTDAFLRTFALRRRFDKDFRYFASPKPPNPAELAPLIIVENDKVCVPMHAMLYNALYDTFDELLSSDHNLRDRYFKGRSNYLEARANALLAGLFPNASVVLNTYYETAYAENEHDGLILADRSLLVLEMKSSEMKTPSRDIERCFRNLTDHFKSNRGIQHAYDQTNQVISIVESTSKPIRFYDELGAVAAEIDPKNVDEMFSICVTLESFGILAVDLTLLLNVSASKPYPLVINLYDLEALVDGFQRKGLSGKDFLRYLRQRRNSQGRLVSGDELNLAGKFIADGALPNIPEGTFVLVADDYANIFDDLFFEKHGVKSNLVAGAIPGGVQMDLRESLNRGQPAFVRPDGTSYVRTAKVGRNKPCPCGSTKKYKKCCGRAA